MENDSSSKVLPGGDVCMEFLLIVLSLGIIILIWENEEKKFRINEITK